MLLMLLGRERVLVRVAVPRPLSRRGNAIRLGISHEPGDERQRRVASRGHPRRREEEAPGLVVVEDPSRAGLPDAFFKIEIDSESDCLRSMLARRPRRGLFCLGGEFGGLAPRKLATQLDTTAGRRAQAGLAACKTLANRACA